MKFKKTISTFIMLAMVLVLSQSAFAATGIADTREKAITMFLPQSPITLFISDAEDQDWYTWTNNTGQDRFIYVNLQSGSGNTFIKLGYQINTMNLYIETALIRTGLHGLITQEKCRDLLHGLCQRTIGETLD
ncbi:hypothetical protein QJQ58_04810 [Paenibacillus dendritiformis]|uniref:hypothetical protein n=1 Tax=Paenibacillus dendritiformis TaxID=130049 RepID=UPI00248C02AF|nr:hypothetical protein [Paenibacillus dendritiformis]WGU95596.1 hypothetical protein QJQ58_04810 [Paenibacillus dendritiformis]